MVFSELLDNLSSLLSSQENNKAKKTENINKEAINELQQGMVLLKTRKRNINKLRNKLKLIENLKDFSKGEETLKKTSDKELKYLNDLETQFQRQIAKYSTNYKTFMSAYNDGMKSVRDCKTSCTAKYPRNTPNYAEKVEACKAGCDLKGPYVQACKNSYTTNKNQENCDTVTMGMCQDGNVLPGDKGRIVDNTDPDRYADSAGTSIRSGCCKCGGGYGGPPTWEKNGKVIKECSQIADALGLKGNDGGWAITACNQARVDNSTKNSTLHEDYGQLTKENEGLIATAQTIFEKIQELQQAREDIDVDMGGLDVKLDTQLTKFGTTFADIKRIRSSKDRTIDGQLEDAIAKENSSSLQFIIWSGLAILTILLVLQRMRK
jgi:hypothetical protein